MCINWWYLFVLPPEDSNTCKVVKLHLYHLLLQHHFSNIYVSTALNSETCRINPRLLWSNRLCSCVISCDLLFMLFPGIDIISCEGSWCKYRFTAQAATKPGKNKNHHWLNGCIFHICTWPPCLGDPFLSHNKQTYRLCVVVKWLTVIFLYDCIYKVLPAIFSHVVQPSLLRSFTLSWLCKHIGAAVCLHLHPCVSLS